MSSSYSRRSLLGQAGAASLGWLCTQRFAFANSTASNAASVPITGHVGMTLTVTAFAPHVLRLSLAASDEDLDRYYDDGSVASRASTPPILSQQTEAAARTLPFEEYSVQLEPSPLRISVRHPVRGLVQQLTFRPELNQIEFTYNDSPVYGLGPGSHPLDRRGTRDVMRNGAGDDLRVFGARNPIPWLMGRGWGLFFHEPGGTFDLTGEVGLFRPSDPARGQDIFLALDQDPAALLRAYMEITGFPHLPARWTLGFQQSHRILDSRDQILEEARTFREKQLPCDALIYLGTGFCPLRLEHRTWLVRL